MDMKFYRCEKCGQIIAIVKKKPCSLYCCGEPVKEIIPGSVDASAEKHVPVYEVKDGKVYVTVGSAEHPMLPEHFIQFIALQTAQGVQVKNLKPGDAPKAFFALCGGEQVEAVYAYCNLHSLWKA